ncbi:MAG: hypothetical protein AB1813_28815 [Verrucomicrobiota bacterium]
MATLPHLNEEDQERIQSALGDFLAKSEAEIALVTAEGGYVLFQASTFRPGLDETSLGALASNAFAASQMIAGMIGEPNFNSLYQQGEKFSLLVQTIDRDNNCLVVVFPAHISVGAVKYYAVMATQAIAEQLARARQRAPGAGIDPAMLNLQNPSEIFQKRP